MLPNLPFPAHGKNTYEIRCSGQSGKWLRNRWPARHTKGDLFICDVADAELKDIMPQMEHPFS